MHCPKFIMHILTEPDGETFCPVRVIALTGCIQYFTHSAFVTYKTGVFDAQAYAIGLGALVAGVGAALKLKDSRNDSPKQ